jgi:hypothetical protein
LLLDEQRDFHEVVARGEGVRFLFLDEETHHPIVGFLINLGIHRCYENFAYGAHKQDDYLRMTESISIASMYQYCKAMVAVFGILFERKQ